MSEDGNGSVRITLRDVYEAVEALQGDVHDIKQSVAALPDHEKRLRTLENQVFSMVGSGQSNRNLWTLIIAGIALVVTATAPFWQHLLK